MKITYLGHINNQETIIDVIELNEENIILNHNMMSYKVFNEQYEKIENKITRTKSMIEMEHIMKNKVEDVLIKTYNYYIDLYKSLTQLYVLFDGEEKEKLLSMIDDII